MIKNKRDRKWEIINCQIKSSEDIILFISLIVYLFGVYYIKNDNLLIGDEENKVKRKCDSAPIIHEHFL